MTTTQQHLLGHSLRHHREERGLSQEELAAQVGVHGYTIAQWESGAAYLQPQKLAALARALGVAEAELAASQPPQPQGTSFEPADSELREPTEPRISTSEDSVAAPGPEGITSSPETLAALEKPHLASQERPGSRSWGRGSGRVVTPFGDLLRKRRLAQGLTREQLGDLIGVPAASLATYETTNTYPSAKYLSRLIEGLTTKLGVDRTRLLEQLYQPRRPMVPTALGRRLRQLRSERGLTQKLFAVGAGLHQAAISSYETGRAYPNRRGLEALAKVLGIQVEELEKLCPNAPPPQEPTQPSPSQIPPFGDELARIRRQQGITQEQLAERLGISQLAIDQWERGTRRLEPWEIVPLARALGSPEGEFAKFLPPHLRSSSFARALRNIRCGRKLNQRELAELVGVGPEIIASYENGEDYPDLKTLFTLARELGVSRQQLSGFVPRSGPDRVSSAFGKMLREARLARGLTQGQLAQLIGINQTTIASYERTHSHPAPRHIPHLVSVLNLVLGMDRARLEESLSRPRSKVQRTAVGRRLRQLRIERKLSQKELAARAGCPPPAISSYELGKSVPNRDSAAKIAEALGVDSTEFEGLLPARPPPAKSTPFGSELSRLRKQRELSQMQLAARVGVARTLISAFELGVANPNRTVLASLASALGVPSLELEKLLPAPSNAAEFPGRLRRIRRQRGLTQGQLAERAGCGLHRISSYERDESPEVSAEDIAALAKALDVPVKELAP